MITFPWISSSIMCRKASRTSLRGYVLSMIGVIFPLSRSSLRTAIASC